MVKERDGALLEVLQQEEKGRIVSEQTSETMRYILEQVVDGGSGKNAYIEGYRIGGKTATSETLPRSANKYISSFIGFAPAEIHRFLCCASLITRREFITEAPSRLLW